MLDETPVHATTELFCAEAAEPGDASAPLLALLHLPYGWAVIRQYREWLGGVEATFTLFDSGGDERTYTRAYLSSGRGAHDDEFYVHPGSTTSRIESEEARGRAVLMVLAAHECDRMESAHA